MTRRDAIMRAPRPPQRLTRLQIKRELERRDLWATFKGLVAADESTAEEWGLAVEIRIDDPLTAGMAAALGLDDAAVGDFFREAEARTVR